MPFICREGYKYFPFWVIRRRVISSGNRLWRRWCEQKWNQQFYCDAFHFCQLQAIGGIKRSADGKLHFKPLVEYSTGDSLVHQVLPASNVSIFQNIIYGRDVLSLEVKTMGLLSIVLSKERQVKQSSRFSIGPTSSLEHVLFMQTDFAKDPIQVSDDFSLFL